jgi:hypothetical protein
MNTLADPLASSSSRSRNALAAILSGGILAGALDLIFAFSYHGIVSGAVPTQILQAIASGLMGRDAFASTMPAAAVGFVAHFVILIIAAAMYYAASRRLTLLGTHAYLSGMAFGIAIYCTMNYIIVPLSAAPTFKWSLPQALSDFSVHMLLLGPAIALAIRYFDKAPAAQ